MAVNSSNRFLSIIRNYQWIINLFIKNHLKYKSTQHCEIILLCASDEIQIFPVEGRLVDFVVILTKQSYNFGHFQTIL